MEALTAQSGASDRLAARYNVHSPSVKRILREIRELHKSPPSSLFTAAPLEDNIYEWHFTLRGPRGTPFEGGVYHGKILLPDDYPFKPPDIIFLTTNGRFEVGRKVCLTISSHHAETWQPSWSVRTVVLAILAFMPTRGDGAIASLDWPAEERKKAAAKSLAFKCDQCGTYNLTALPPEDESENVPEPPPELTIKNKEQQERDEKAKQDDARTSGDVGKTEQGMRSAENDVVRQRRNVEQEERNNAALEAQNPAIVEAVANLQGPGRVSARIAPRNSEIGTARGQWIDVFISLVLLLIVVLVVRRWLGV